ncbi:DUF7674 family protein [Polluticaenibacter yanchengensis]|uniref:DUF7674 domain-containing protein n=1 Tax=Polluticaenibacter yanchengensis TaxID=3014562 RepID=A0ABT4UG48_9BACT|nr:hypothetical protein [Chitinophagaceae bacterium LY-5]
MDDKSAIQKIQQLTAKTLRAICGGEKKNVSDLYAQVEQLYGKGSSYTRSIISTTFILPLSQFLEMNDKAGKAYLNLLPTELNEEYRRQIYSTGV